MDFQDRFDALWYKWQFLRRNERYRSDFTEFNQRFAAWFSRNCSLCEPVYAKTEADWKYFCEVLAPAAKKFCEKWGVEVPTPPEWQFEKSSSMERLPNGLFPVLPTIVNEIPGDHFDIEYIPSDASIEERMRGISLEIEEIDWNDPKKYWIDFDLHEPFPLLVDHLKRMVHFGRQKFGLPESPEFRSKPRRRFADYDNYLRAWDLRRDGILTADIAKLIHPRVAPETSIQRVRNYLRRADKLIQGGYVQID